jgi:hypothetical protein
LIIQAKEHKKFIETLLKFTFLDVEDMDETGELLYRTELDKKDFSEYLAYYYCNYYLFEKALRQIQNNNTVILKTAATVIVSAINEEIELFLYKEIKKNKTDMLNIDSIIMFILSEKEELFETEFFSIKDLVDKGRMEEAWFNMSLRLMEIVPFQDTKSTLSKNDRGIYVIKADSYTKDYTNLIEALNSIMLTRPSSFEIIEKDLEEEKGAIEAYIEKFLSFSQTTIKFI